MLNQRSSRASGIGEYLLFWERTRGERIKPLCADNTQGGLQRHDY